MEADGCLVTGGASYRGGVVHCLAPSDGARVLTWNARLTVRTAAALVGEGGDQCSSERRVIIA